MIKNHANYQFEGSQGRQTSEDPYVLALEISFTTQNMGEEKCFKCFNDRRVTSDFCRVSLVTSREATRL